MDKHNMLINSIGNQMYDMANQLFPICRSLMGNGFRRSLKILTKGLKDISMYEIPTGTEVLDWIVPKEWNIYGGYIETLGGSRVIDFNKCNLHIMGYSTPINTIITKEELFEHIYTLPNQPDVIPYVTSYYKENWGFCMSEKTKQKLMDDKYHVVIDSELKEGSLTLCDIVIPGQTKDEIMFTTYLCHPSMANNELSGPVVWRALIDYVNSLPNRRYTYRFVINPETLGAISYIDRHINVLKQHLKAGFVLSCVGDNRSFSYVASKYGNTLADRVTKNVMQYCQNYVSYSFLQRGSDERQYCSAGVDLPVCGICRTKYGAFPEYHTSADDMSLISPEGLQGAYDVCVNIIKTLEQNYHYVMTCMGEPQLGKRGLYSTISMKGSSDSARIIRDFTAYADGNNDLIDISNHIGVPTSEIIPIIHKLYDAKLIVIKSEN